jgi:hypothetical protein
LNTLQTPHKTELPDARTLFEEMARNIHEEETTGTPTFLSSNAYKYATIISTQP